MHSWPSLRETESNRNAYSENWMSFLYRTGLRKNLQNSFDLAIAWPRKLAYKYPVPLTVPFFHKSQTLAATRARTDLAEAAIDEPSEVNIASISEPPRPPARL